MSYELMESDRYMSNEEEMNSKPRFTLLGDLKENNHSSRLNQSESPVRMHFRELQENSQSEKENQQVNYTQK